jgi:hypothetical protein
LDNSSIDSSQFDEDEDYYIYKTILAFQQEMKIESDTVSDEIGSRDIDKEG